MKLFKGHTNFGKPIKFSFSFVSTDQGSLKKIALTLKCLNLKTPTIKLNKLSKITIFFCPMNVSEIKTELRSAVEDLSTRGLINATKL
jgi:hypothetical protein